jgi:hypothetical protein
VGKPAVPNLVDVLIEVGRDIQREVASVAHVIGIE